MANAQCVHVCVSTFVCARVCVHACMRVCVCVCVTLTASEAYTKSYKAMMVTEMPMAGPLTAATRGLGKLMKASTNLLSATKKYSCTKRPPASTNMGKQFHTLATTQHTLRTSYNAGQSQS